LSIEEAVTAEMPRGFRRGGVISVTYSGFARCGLLHRAMFGATPDEALRDVLGDLGLGPREIMLRAVGDEIEVRGDEDEFGPGVLFAVVWRGLAKADADAARRDLIARDWVPMRRLAS
jgi:hypothetical protein